MTYKVDQTYNANSRPRNKLKQVGASAPYTAYNKPLLKRLEVYENTFKYEPIIQQSLNVMIDALLGALGPIEHPDSDIQEFCRYSLSHHLDTYCVDIFAKLREVSLLTMWGGFSVTEPIYEIYNGQIIIKDYVTYHPSTITIRTNKVGQLVEGDESYEGPHLRSGVYQSTNTKYGEVLLPLWKIALLTYNKEFNNYYGTSIVENCYRWHVLKEAFTDMLTTTLDRYGNPLTMITVPQHSSGEVRINPITGEQTTLNMHELLEEQIKKGYVANESNFLLLPFFDGTLKPDAKVLSGTNNLGSSFLDAIQYCESQIIRNLLIPFNLINTTADGSSGEGALGERQIEMFNRVITTLYRTIVVPFVSQTIHKQVLFNFTRDSAKVPPKFPLRKTTRPEARVALMQMIKGLTEAGYLNPLNEADWSSIREMVDALDRPMEKEDQKFINDVLIEPRKKPKPASNANSPSRQGPSGTGNEGKPTGKSMPQQQANPKT